VQQSWFAAPQSFQRCLRHFCFYSATTNRSYGFSIGENQHFAASVPRYCTFRSHNHT
jgi:hypothetical protein